jgi:hypothetical protein
MAGHCALVHRCPPWMLINPLAITRFGMVVPGYGASSDHAGVIVAGLEGRHLLDIAPGATGPGPDPVRGSCVLHSWDVTDVSSVGTTCKTGQLPFHTLR